MATSPPPPLPPPPPPPPSQPSNPPPPPVLLPVPTVAGLTTSAELTRRQLAINRAKAATAHRSSLAGLTLRVAMQDMREAVLGIPRDVARATNHRVSLGYIFLKNDRLRGIGLVLLLGSVLALVAA